MYDLLGDALHSYVRYDPTGPRQLQAERGTLVSPPPMLHAFCTKTQTKSPVRPRCGPHFHRSPQLVATFLVSPPYDLICGGSWSAIPSQLSL